MIPTHRVKNAYDALNLDRDASMQEIIKRFNSLVDRCKSSGDLEKLSQVEDAFHVLREAEVSLQAQRNMVSNQSRSRSERELDGRLTEMTSKIGATEKRSLEPSDDNVKRQKPDAYETVTEVKAEAEESGSTAHDDSVVFEKLNSLLKDESKYLRAVNVLFSLVKSVVDKNQFAPQSIRMLIYSVDLASSSLASSDVHSCLANLTEDNRKAITKVVNLIIYSEDLSVRITNEKPEIVRMWSHSVVFRNSLFEQDNFIFVKKCKELVSMVSAAKVPPHSDSDERWILELSRTANTLCSKAVCKVIPGRLRDVKSTMTEIYKISRNFSFPQNFRDRIADLQREIMSY